MGDPAIRIRDLAYAWEPGRTVLDIAELDIAPGERVFLRGPSGSGKTTLLNLIGGVATPDRGTIEIGGTSLSALSAPRRDRLRADRIGFVFQLFNLIPYLDLVQNVALPCQFSAPRRARAAQSGGVEAEAHRLLRRLGLDDATIARKEVTALSVGQQQRVAAARALIGGPAVLIADEPTSALDEAAGRAFIELLLEEAAQSGASIVFVSHDARLAPAFDRSVALPAINRARAR